MGFAFTIIGLIAVITGVKGTHNALGNQLVKDLTGPGGFIYWFIAVVVIYAASRIPVFKKAAFPFLLLVIMAMLLSNRGFFQKFMEGIRLGPIAPPREQAAAAEPSQANAANPDLANVATITGNLAKLAPMVLV